MHMHVLWVFFLILGCGGELLKHVRDKWGIGSGYVCGLKSGLTVSYWYFWPNPTHPISNPQIHNCAQLGGKNAGLVFNDVDLKKCLPIMVRSSFSNQGEICLTTSRIYVQEGIYEKFVERYVELTRSEPKLRHWICVCVCVCVCVFGWEGGG